MLRSCSRLWPAMAILLVLWLPLGAQDKPAGSIQNLQEASQDLAVRALVEQYFAAYARKDLAAMTALWSAKSPDLETQRKATEQFFAANDKVEVRDVTVQRLSVEGEKAHLRVGLELKATDAKTGGARSGPGKMTRNLECVKEGSVWRVWRDRDAAEELAALLVAGKSEPEGAAVLEREKDSLPPGLAHELLKQAWKLRGDGNFARALSVLALAQQVAEQTDDQGGLSSVVRNIGIVYDLEGDHRRALDNFEKSLEIADKLGNQRLVASSLNNLGIAQQELGDYTSALKSYRRSLDLAETPRDNPVVANALSNIGEVLRLQGQYTEAMEYYRRALALEEADESDPSSPARTLNNMGLVANAQNDYAQALRYYQKAMALVEKGGDRQLVGLLLSNSASTLISQGDYAGALDYLHRSLGISEQLGAEGDIAFALQEIGFVEEQQGDYVAALKDYRKSLALEEELGEKDQTVNALNDIGAVLSLQKDYKGALESHLKGLALAEELNSPPLVAQTCYLVSLDNYQQGRLERAVEFAQRASDIARKIGDRETLFVSQTSAAKAFRSLGQTATARQALTEAIDVVETMLSDVAGSEEAQERFFERKITPYQEMVELLVSEKLGTEALVFAERAKAKALLAVLHSGKTQVAKAMTEGERQREEQLQADLFTLNTRLQRESQETTPDPSRLKDLQARLEQARLEYSEFQTNLFVAHPELKVERGRVQPMTSSDASVLLEPGRALLEFAVGEEKAHLFVLTRKDGNNSAVPELEVYSIPVGDKELKRKAEHFREQLEQRDFSFRASSRELFSMLIKPAMTQLAGKNALVIVPDGPLWNLPFQALVGDNGRYLLEDYAVAYAPSLTVLREMTNVRRKRNLHLQTEQSPTLLAMADPVLVEQAVSAAALTYRGGKPAPLPDARREAAALKQLYGHKHSEVYVGDGAREDVFKAEAAKFEVLHLATHGVFNDASPMYSHILLSPGKPNAKEDGLLEAWEIMQMDLKADLAVLSACETGRGRISAGEGMIGLTWAFFVAGVPTTVVSQWKVESASTAKLMLAFHRTLKAGDAQSSPPFATARALQHAELQLLHDSQYSHPFYWAGFVVMGDPR